MAGREKKICLFFCKCEDFGEVLKRVCYGFSFWGLRLYYHFFGFLGIFVMSLIFWGFLLCFVVFVGF
jgi:hypothetical protein